MNTIIPLIVAILAGTIGNIAIKFGMKEIPQTGFDFSLLGKILSQPWVVLGIIFLAGSFPFYSIVIQRMGLSFGFPLLTSSTLILASVASYFLFRESLTLMNIFGMLLLVAGLWLVAQK